MPYASAESDILRYMRHHGMKKRLREWLNELVMRWTKGLPKGRMKKSRTGQYGGRI